MVQLLQARSWAAGALGAPLSDQTASRLVQNGVLASPGWVSVYPPGHTALLALGFGLGVPWLVGPALTAATTLAARRLLSARPGAALAGGVLVAFSPFVVLLGGGYLSHASAAAAAALALYAALLARDGRAGWAAAAGLATGVLVAIRPWTGVVLGLVLTEGVWAAAAARRAPAPFWKAAVRWFGKWVALWPLGGLPVAAAFALYHRTVFGHPLRLGYAAAFGPAHGLGFHPDPWGNRYGTLEALAYSGFDLMALGTHLLETPVSVVGLVGVWLVLAPVGFPTAHRRAAGLGDGAGAR